MLDEVILCLRKHEITNFKSETNSKIQISNVYVFKIYNFGFVWNLDFGISDFRYSAVIYRDKGNNSVG